MKKRFYTTLFASFFLSTISSNALAVVGGCEGNLCIACTDDLSLCLVCVGDNCELV
jgi:hypothetical protein